MSITEKIKARAMNTKRGKPFLTTRFLDLGSRSAVDKALSRLVAEGAIERVKRGVFVRPEKSIYVGTVMPSAVEVIEAITKQRGETIQIHGAEAARRFKLSTQMPVSPVYYTNGTSRKIPVGKLTVKLIHTNNQKKLQHAGKKIGEALSALWYLGKEQVTPDTVEMIRKGLTTKEFETLRKSSMPAWMMKVINKSNQREQNA